MKKGTFNKVIKHYIYLPPIGQGTKRKTYPIDMQLLIQTPMQP